MTVTEPQAGDALVKINQSPKEQQSSCIKKDNILVGENEKIQTDHFFLEVEPTDVLMAWFWGIKKRRRIKANTLVHKYLAQVTSVISWGNF